MTWLKISHLERFAKGFEEKARALFAKKTDIPTALPANGGDALTVNGHHVNKDVPADADFGNTQYDVMGGASTSTEGTAGLVPKPGKGMQNAFLKGDGTWENMEEATDEDIDAIIAGTFK